jgi:hypothetical protein
MISPKENMLRILRGEKPGWIPLSLYSDNFNHPNVESMPPDLREKFEKGENPAVALSEFLGVDEYILNAPCPFKTTLRGAEETHNNDGSSVITVKSGRLEQKRECCSGESYVTRRYVRERGDLAKLSEYFEAMRFELNPDALADIKAKKAFIKDNGLLWLFTYGTPLGMMYRVYSEISDLVFLIADHHDDVRELFSVMERRYLECFELILKNVPEIDILVGMDDTSTTLISPAMFDEFNVGLTNTRADLAHKHGKFYLHHSCGLIKDLLPVYRKTRMDGVHAFTTPPIGNTWFSEGRKLLGERPAIFTSCVTAAFEPEDKDLKNKVKARFEDARAAGGVSLYFAVPNSSYSVDFMRKVLDEARKYQLL